MNRKGSALVVIILVVVIILAVIAGIWYFESHSTPSISQPVSQNSSTSTVVTTSTNTTSTQVVAVSTTTVAACDATELNSTSSFSEYNLPAEPSNINVALTSILNAANSPIQGYTISPDQTFYFLAMVGQENINSPNNNRYEIESADASEVLSGNTQNFQVLTTIPFDSFTAPFYFTAGNGIVLDAPVYSSSSQEISTSLYAIDAQTGKQLWMVQGPITNYPRIIGNAVYVPTSYGLVKVDITTGKSLWQFSQAHDAVALINNTIYTDTGCSLSGCDGAQATDTVYALDPQTGKVLQSIPFADASVSSWDQCGGNIYFLDDEGPRGYEVYRLNSSAQGVTAIGALPPN